MALLVIGMESNLDRELERERKKCDKLRDMCACVCEKKGSKILEVGAKDVKINIKRLVHKTHYTLTIIATSPKIDPHKNKNTHDHTYLSSTFFTSPTAIHTADNLYTVTVNFGLRKRIL